MEEQEVIKLTQYSRGAGCGCKIAPAVLQEILKTDMLLPQDEKLLVGYHSKDDAAVYDMGNGTALVSTADFFMPIVDDAFDFGRIAAANAISDVYAMGGKPVMAIAILGWPVEKLPVTLAQKVLEGARTVCAEAGIVLAGGHSIDTAEPMFGLSVSGLVDIKNLKKNNTAGEGDLLFLTKPLGTGILSTAQKRGVLTDEYNAELVKSMTTLNKIGAQLGAIADVTALSDVTGFGLLGHLLEMAEGSGLSASISYNAISVLPGAREYLSQRIVPDATYRNWNSYSSQVFFAPGVNVMEAFSLLPDPQTNGGLLIAVREAGAAQLVALFKQHGLEAYTTPIGKMIARQEKYINVSN